MALEPTPAAVLARRWGHTSDNSPFGAASETTAENENDTLGIGSGGAGAQVFAHEYARVDIL